MINRNFRTISSRTRLGNFQPLTSAVNADFYNKIAKRNMIASLHEASGSLHTPSSLIYALSSNNQEPDETSNTIINLLLQMRLFQSEQNAFLKNSAVLKQNLWEQLERELSYRRQDLGPTQIQHIKNVVVNNQFDKKEFNKLLESFSSKKKDSPVQQVNQYNYFGGKKPTQQHYIPSLQREILNRYEQMSFNKSEKFVTDRILSNVKLIDRETRTTEQIENEKLDRQIEAKNLETRVKELQEREILKLLTRENRLIRKITERQAREVSKILSNEYRITDKNTQLQEREISKILARENRLKNLITQVNNKYQRSLEHKILNRYEQMSFNKSEKFVTDRILDNVKLIDRETRTTEQIESQKLDRQLEAKNLETQVKELQEREISKVLMLENRQNRKLTELQAREVSKVLSNEYRVTDKSTQLQQKEISNILKSEQRITDKNMQLQEREFSKILTRENTLRNLITRVNNRYQKSLEREILNRYERISFNKSEKFVTDRLLNNVKLIDRETRTTEQIENEKLDRQIESKNLETRVKELQEREILKLLTRENRQTRKITELQAREISKILKSEYRVTDKNTHLKEREISKILTRENRLKNLITQVNNKYQKSLEREILNRYERMSFNKSEKFVTDRILNNVKLIERETRMTEKIENEKLERQLETKNLETRVKELQELEISKVLTRENKQTRKVAERQAREISKILKSEQRITDRITQLQSREISKILSNEYRITDKSTQRQEREISKILTCENRLKNLITQVNNKYQKSLEREILNRYEQMSFNKSEKFVTDRILSSVKLIDRETRTTEQIESQKLDRQLEAKNLETRIKELQAREISNILTRENRQTRNITERQAREVSKILKSEYRITDKSTQLPQKEISKILKSEQRITDRITQLQAREISKILSKEYRITDKSTQLQEREFSKILTRENRLKNLITRVNNKYQKSLEREILNRYEQMSFNKSEKFVTDRILNNVKLIDRETRTAEQIESQKLDRQLESKNLETRVRELQAREISKILTRENRLTRRVTERQAREVSKILSKEYRITDKNTQLKEKEISKILKSEQRITDRIMQLQAREISKIVKSEYRTLQRERLKTFETKFLRAQDVNLLEKHQLFSRVQNLSNVLYSIQLPTFIRSQEYFAKAISNTINRHSQMRSLTVPGKSQNLDRERVFSVVNRIYYNDMVEQIGQKFAETPVADKNFTNVTYREFVYKKPIDISKISAKAKEKSPDEIFKSQLSGSQHDVTFETQPMKPQVYNYGPGAEYVTKAQAQQMVQDYIRSSDISVDEISRKVMDKIERVLKTQRRRFGMAR